MKYRNTIFLYAAVFCVALAILYVSAGLFLYAVLGLYKPTKFVCDWDRYKAEHETMMKNPNDDALREDYAKKIQASCRHEERSFSEKMIEMRIFALYGVPIVVMRSIPRIQCQFFGNCPVIQKGG